MSTSVTNSLKWRCRFVVHLGHSISQRLTSAWFGSQVPDAPVADPQVTAENRTFGFAPIPDIPPPRGMSRKQTFARCRQPFALRASADRLPRNDQPHEKEDCTTTGVVLSPRHPTGEDAAAERLSRRPCKPLDPALLRCLVGAGASASCERNQALLSCLLQRARLSL